MSYWSSSSQRSRGPACLRDGCRTRRYESYGARPLARVAASTKVTCLDESVIDRLRQWRTLGEVRLTWDDAKNLANQKKHGVSFEEASRLFTSGADYLEIFDEDHSDEEERFIAIGPIKRGMVLVVSTEIGEGALRIISARWATKRERNAYETFIKETR